MEEPQPRKGWRRLPNGKWEPVAPPEGPAPEPIDLTGLDESLDASHRRMRYALAVQSRRLELAAQKGHLTAPEVMALGEIANTWRTLVTHEPPPDLSEMTEDQIKTALAAVKARGK